MVDYGEQITGTRDEHYNLISVLYHALHGAENCDRYASDAEISGDERLAAFFRETQSMHTQVAERAKGLLGILEPPPEFGTSPATDTTASGSTPEMPRTPLRGTPEDVERGTVSDTPVVPPGEGVPPYVDSPPGEERPPREEPSPGEERPERRGAAPTPPSAREEPPPGEERPGRRTSP
jgi:hypothetical protein